jgi:hypothetical protein
VTYVAYRRAEDCPGAPGPGAPDKQYDDYFEALSRITIGLAHDGEEFIDFSEEDCARRLEWLRSEGYRVPQRAIDRLLAEANRERER